MMRTLRKKMSIFLWFVAIAFILFIFLQWGMNVSGRKTGDRNITTIAKVNGISIKTQTYQEQANKIMNNLRDSQNLTYIDPMSQRIIEENVFEELVQKSIIQNIIRKNNIYVTNDEIKELIKISPPKEIIQDSLMYTNGKFDHQKYLELLLNPANRQWLYEQQIRFMEDYPMKKLTSMYSSGIKVTQQEALKSYQEESLKVKVEYIPFRLEDYLTLVSPSEEELKDYYTIHKEEYGTGEGVRLKSVCFEVKASLADAMEAKREIDDIYNLYKNGMNFDTLAMDYSQDNNSNQNSGNIGFVKRGDLEQPMEKIAFALKKGKVSEPFQTSMGWHFLKVTDIKGKERDISHILIKIVPGYETISDIKERIETFKKQVKEMGFDKAIEISNLQEAENILYSDDGDLFPEIGRVIGINNFLFNNKKEETTLIGPFVGYNDNFYIFLVEGYLETSIPNLEEIKEKIEEKVKREKALELAKKDAENCFEEIKKGKSLKTSASMFSRKTKTTNFFSMTDLIPGVPFSSEFYGLVFTLKEGNIGLATTKKGGFIVKLLKRNDVKKEGFQKYAGSLLANLMMKKRNDLLTYWFQNLRKNAKIKDNRYLLDIY